METLESLRKKITGATEIQSVVRTMKTMAAANIGQYEMAVNSLEDYYRTIVLGLIAYFREEKIGKIVEKKRPQKKVEKSVGAIVFGSDLGLVGQFNDSLSSFALRFLNKLPGKKEVWPVGERIQLFLSESGLNTTHLFSVPNSVDAITPLVGQILIKSQQSIEEGSLQSIYIFYNKTVCRSPASHHQRIWFPYKICSFAGCYFNRSDKGFCRRYDPVFCRTAYIGICSD